MRYRYVLLITFIIGSLIGLATYALLCRVGADMVRDARKPLINTREGSVDIQEALDSGGLVLDVPKSSLKVVNARNNWPVITFNPQESK